MLEESESAKEQMAAWRFPCVFLRFRSPAIDATAGRLLTISLGGAFLFAWDVVKCERLETALL
jgi:hypothetical protein